MAIEGPLRELGIHDVFQLLDLSRKTGTLRITSPERNNEGSVYFDAGTFWGRSSSGRGRPPRPTWHAPPPCRGQVTSAASERFSSPTE